MTSVPPPPPPPPPPPGPGGVPPQPEPSQHPQFAPPGTYSPAGSNGGQQGQYAPPAQPWGAPQQWQHAQPGQPGQPSHYPQPAQPGQYAPPGQPWGQAPQWQQHAQPGPYSQPGQQLPWGPPPPAPSGRSKRPTVLLAILGAVVVVGLAVAAFFVFSTSDVEPLPKDVDATTTVHARSLTVGNCLQSVPGGAVVSEVTVVPCAEEHAAQVVAGKTFAGETFPGEATVVEQTTAVCPGRSITSDAAPEALDFLVWTPSDESWTEGDRRGLCVAASPDAPLTGSLIR